MSHHRTVGVWLAASIAVGPPMPIQTPVAVRYSVSGIVTDDTGAAVAGARISVSYRPPPNGNGLPGITSARTDATGRYAMHFDATRPLYEAPFAVADIFATNGDDFVQQMLPWGTTTVVKDLVIRQAETITAGESATVAVDTISSVCSDREDRFLLTLHCGQIHVVAPANGTLVINARPLQDAAIVPVVFSATSGGSYQRQFPGPGTVTLLEVRQFQSYRIFVGSPEGTVSQTYAVTTSLQKRASAGQR